VDAALSAALALHERIRAMPAVGDIRLALHSGIHAGLVLMRKGDAAKGRFEAVGLATAIAARLAAAALPHEILVSDATLGPARWRYAVGVQGVGVAERAYQKAVAFARASALGPATETSPSPSQLPSKQAVTFSMAGAGRPARPRRYVIRTNGITTIESNIWLMSRVK